MKTKGEKLAQKLGDMAPNELEPWKYRRIVSNLGYSILGRDDSVGCRAVSQGSASHNEGFVAVQHSKDHNSSVALIGKGITFDTGGYSIKGCRGMVGMKYDMMGSAVALGATLDLNGAKPLSTYLCISENRISSRALLPDSLLRYPDGTKVIVEDTDAEGRLVLADGIIAAKQLKPYVLITVATLTGSIVAALGENTVGAFCTHDDHWLKVQSAFRGSKIAVWRMPFLEEEAKLSMKMPKGCITNLNHASRVPGASYAASFLKHFAGKTPLIHLDIAGVAHKDKQVRVDMAAVLARLVKLL